MLEVEITSRRWKRFDEAVYKFAHECAEAERNEAGRLDLPGRKLWAYKYITAFFARIDREVFKGVEGLDEDLIQREVEGRFVWVFQEAWREAR
jgi:hypothetical protein